MDSMAEPPRQRGELKALIKAGNQTMAWKRQFAKITHSFSLLQSEFISE